MCGADSTLPSGHHKSAVPKKQLRRFRCSEQAATGTRPLRSSHHSISRCANYVIICCPTSKSLVCGTVRRGPPHATSPTCSMHAGVGTTMVVSMALGAVYLGVFQAATRGLSKVEALHSPLSPVSSTSAGQGLAGSAKQQGKQSHDGTSSGPQAALLAALFTSVAMAVLTGVLLSFSRALVQLHACLHMHGAQKQRVALNVQHHEPSARRILILTSRG